MGKVELNKRKKMESLLDTAFGLFTEHGFVETSIADISKKAGVAKGTFYLYFKDKYDLRDRLVAYKSSLLVENAYKALQETDIDDFTDSMVFLAEHILDTLDANHSLLSFIHRNLHWNVFRHALTEYNLSNNLTFLDVYHQLAEHSNLEFRDPEVMLYMIVELIGSAGCDAILFEDPCNMETLKPHLSACIRDIVRQFTVH